MGPNCVSVVALGPFHALVIITAVLPRHPASCRKVLQQVGLLRPRPAVREDGQDRVGANGKAVIVNGIVERKVFRANSIGAV